MGEWIVGVQVSLYQVTPTWCRSSSRSQELDATCEVLLMRFSTRRRQHTGDAGSRLALSSVVVRQRLLAFFPPIESLLQQVDELG